MSTKVLHINFNDSGGAAIASMDLHEALLKEGIQSKYLCLNLTKEHHSDLQYFSHRRIYKGLIRKAWYLYVKAYFINKKNARLKRLIPEPNDPITLPYSSFDITLDPLYKEADIIHLHWTARFLDWPSFFRKNQKPIVWTLHDRNPFSGILHCSTDFPEQGKVLEEEVGNKKTHWLNKSRIHVVAPSKQYEELSKSSEVLGKFQHSTIYHGIRQDLFYPLDKTACREKHNLPLNKTIFLSVASDLKRKLKGFEELIEFARIQQDLFFVFIGDKAPKTVDLKNVVYTGKIEDRQDLNEWYNAADLTISNSKEESFGLTVAESLSASTPVCSREVGIARESHIGLEIFNDVKQIPNIASRILQLSPPSNSFLMSTCVENYLSLYSKIMNTHETTKQG